MTDTFKQPATIEANGSAFDVVICIDPEHDKPSRAFIEECAHLARHFSPGRFNVKPRYFGNSWAWAKTMKGAQP